MRKLTVLILIGAFISIFLLLPIELGAVTSSSMEPSIEEKESFIFYETQNVQVGDIIIFESKTQDTTYTHRIVGESDTGYITKGDNNPSTDQSIGIEEVRDEDIIGKVITVQQEPLIIPFLNLDHLKILDKYSYVFLLLLLVIVMLDYHAPSIDELDMSPQIWVSIFFILLFIVMSSILYIPNEVTHEFVVTQQDVNENKEFETTIEKSRLYGEYSTDFIEENDGDISSVSSTSNLATIEHGPYETIGPHTLSVSLYSYPKVLPRGIIALMHNIHPALPSYMTPGIFLSTVYLVSMIALPFEREGSYEKVIR